MNDFLGSEKQKLRNGANVASVVREYFPDATLDEIDDIVWSQTGWPAFWSSPIPGEGNSPEDCFRLQPCAPSLGSR